MLTKNMLTKSMLTENTLTKIRSQKIHLQKYADTKMLTKTTLSLCVDIPHNGDIPP